MVSKTGHIRKAAAVSLLVFAAVVSSAYTRREHYAIAIIAEKYLTPEAKAAVNEIFNGERMALYASYPDEYRAVLRIDGHKFYHTFHVDGDLMPLKSKKSPVYVIMNAAGKLHGWKDMDPQMRKEYLAMVVHLVGDIHCPSHPKYDDPDIPKTVDHYVFGNDSIAFHQAWDSVLAGHAYPGGPFEIAYLADVATPEQRAEYQKGSVIDWAHDSAVYCKDFTRDIKGDKNNNAEVDWPYVAEHAYHAKHQAMKAGYRLAALLNEIFK